VADQLVRTLSRRQMLKLLGIGSAGLIVAACGPAQPAAAPAPTAEPAKAVEPTKEPAPQPTAAPAAPNFEQGELNLYICCSSPEDLDNRAKWNAAWSEKHSGVKVKQDSLPAGQNYFEKLQTLIAADTMPDLYDMWEGYIQPYAANSALADLDPFFAADDKVKKTDLVPAAVEGGGYQDKIYAFCQGFMPGPASLYFNTEHFEKAGLKLPTADWKWDDLRDAAKALTKPDEQWGLSYGLWFVEWLYWVWSNGGDLFDAEQTKCTLADPKATAALQYWADINVKEKTTVTGSEAAAMQGEANAFMTGKVSMYLGNCWDVPALKAAEKEKGFKWGGVLSPKANDGKRVWYEHFWCWGMWPKTKMPKAGWLLMRDFILDQVNQAAQPMVPGIKQALKIFDTQENRKVGYGPLVELATQPGLLRIPGAGAKFDKISQLVQAELDLVWIGEKTAQAAAEAVAPKVDEELARKS
jgi:multiple sugar transport system substrate-binding protein